MADPLSLSAVGAIGVATAFEACIDCFDYLLRGRHFGRDFETSMLLAKCRLIRWGGAVYIDKDPMLGKPDATPEELYLAEKSLLQIVALFSDTEKIRKRHEMSAKANCDLPILTKAPLDREREKEAEFNNTTKEMSIRKQKSSSFIRLASWAMCDESEFAELLASITALIDNLEKLFPPTKSQLEPAKREAVRDNKELLLESSKNDSGEADHKGQAVSVGHLSGHQFHNIAISGTVRLGDEFSENWQGRAFESSHWYNGVVVSETGIAHLGNNFGGKSFWDSP